MLKQHISIKTDCCHLDRPGFTEIGLVGHCDGYSEGDFANMLTKDDLFRQ